MLAVSAVIFADRLEDTFYVPLDDPAIQYAGPVSDPIAHLEKQLESQKTKLDYAPNGWGYLPAVLKQLNINIDSQILVFSRTSIQTSHISPQTPRAIYFNDDTAVGFVQNGEVLELSAIDPKQGVILYTPRHRKIRPARVCAPRRLPALPSGRADHGYSWTHY